MPRLPPRRRPGRGSWERAAILDRDHIAIDADVLERVPWTASAALQQALLLLFIAALLLTFHSPKPRMLTLSETPPPPLVTPRLLRWTSILDLAALIALLIVLVRTGPGRIWFGFPPLLLPIRLALACAALLALCGAMVVLRALPTLPLREQLRQGTIVLAQLGLAGWLAWFRLFW